MPRADPADRPGLPGAGEYDPGVRLAAVEELARGWKEDPETLAIRASKPQLALAASP